MQQFLAATALSAGQGSFFPCIDLIGHVISSAEASFSSGLALPIRGDAA